MRGEEAEGESRMQMRAESSGRWSRFDLDLARIGSQQEANGGETNHQHITSLDGATRQAHMYIDRLNTNQGTRSRSRSRSRSHKLYVGRSLRSTAVGTPPSTHIYLSFLHRHIHIRSRGPPRSSSSRACLIALLLTSKICLETHFSPTLQATRSAAS